MGFLQADMRHAIDSSYDFKVGGGSSGTADRNRQIDSENGIHTADMDPAIKLNRRDKRDELC